MSSEILKGVIEQLAPSLLDDPVVLFISESRRHVDVTEEEWLTALGIAVEAGRLLPDVMLFDADASTYWCVEVVATDGAIHEGRRDALLEWAARQGIDTAACRFVTAFLSRTNAVFRRVFPTLAWGTSVWFLDEPHRIADLRELRSR